MVEQAQGMVVVPSGGGEALSVVGDRYLLKLAGGATEGRYALIESEVRPGSAPPLHRHGREDETFHVLEGEFRFWFADQSFTMGPGGTVHLPKGVPHTFQNVGTTTGRVLVVISPAGFERFFQEWNARELALPDDMAAVLELAGRYDLEILGPPPA